VRERGGVEERERGERERGRESARERVFNEMRARESMKEEGKGGW
jgi:hypothetical protein